jgi:voltage-gated potassium channel
MLHALRRLIKNTAFIVYSYAWLSIAIVMGGLYFTGYFLMLDAGEIEIVENYAWWFIVTATTVGYGDIAPVTSYGRFVAVPIMLLGIGVLALVIAKITEFIMNYIERRKKGLSTMKESNHILIMGYQKGSTEKVIDELLCDTVKPVIILCSQDQDINPLKSDKVHFINGELASKDVLRRSCSADASRIIVHGKDDNQTFFTAYAIREINQHAHLVCYLRNEDHANKINHLPADDRSLNQVILPVNEYLMAQELQDPGSSNIFQQLISNQDGATLYRSVYSNGLKNPAVIGDIFLRLKEDYDATIVALKNDKLITNPSLKESINLGDSIFYIATKRLDSLIE